MSNSKARAPPPAPPLRYSPAAARGAISPRPAVCSAWLRRILTPEPKASTRHQPTAAAHIPGWSSSPPSTDVTAAPDVTAVPDETAAPFARATASGRDMRPPSAAATPQPAESIFSCSANRSLPAPSAVLPPAVLPPTRAPPPPQVLSCTSAAGARNERPPRSLPVLPEGCSGERSPSGWARRDRLLATSKGSGVLFWAVRVAGRTPRGLRLTSKETWGELSSPLSRCPSSPVSPLRARPDRPYPSPPADTSGGPIPLPHTGGGTAAGCASGGKMLRSVCRAVSAAENVSAHISWSIPSDICNSNWDGPPPSARPPFDIWYPFGEAWGWPSNLALPAASS
mmetsp:Transcript_2532/g.8492  ORF Transcript_2532/g.8492 Transcript_2532/m.8492 type:complete len:340 (-) Transcript_2532:3008-4027(-)